MRFGHASLLLFLTACAAPAATDFAPHDEAAVRALIQDYCTTWMAHPNDDAVMELLTADAVILPHHGTTPMVGPEAIRAWWWPAGSPPFVISHFAMDVRGVDGERALATAWGHFALAWHYAATPEQETAVAGTFLMSLRRGADGRWRIHRHMWDDPPQR